MARQLGIDLLVAPQANPPVCKILDYGKIQVRREETKIAKEASF